MFYFLNKTVTIYLHLTFDAGGISSPDAPTTVNVVTSSAGLPQHEATGQSSVSSLEKRKYI